MKESISADEKRYKTLADMLKKECISRFKDGDKTVTVNGASYDWVVSKSMSDGGYDLEKMQTDGIDIEKYHKESKPQYKIQPKARKESA